MSMRNGNLPSIDTKRAEKLVMSLMSVPGKSGQEAAVASIIERELLKAEHPGRGSVHRRDLNHGGVTLSLHRNFGEISALFRYKRNSACHR